MSTTPEPIGWLLLRDNHSAPISGLSPAELKRSRRDAVLVPGLELGHLSGLNGLSGELGFKGGWSTYGRTHWPALLELLSESGADPDRQRDLFARDQDAVDLGFRSKPRRRALADRLFADGRDLPTRVFTGADFDFGVYAAMFSKVLNGWMPGDEEFMPRSLEESRVWLFRNRFELNGGQNYIGGQLLEGVDDPWVFRSYATNNYPDADRQRDEIKQRKTWEVFRWIIEQDEAGWVRVVRCNDHLIFLIAPDGSWDFVWRDLRGAPPTEAKPRDWADQPLAFMPSWLLAEPRFERALYMRRGFWQERVEHEAELAHYEAGGLAGDAYPGLRVLVQRHLARTDERRVKETGTTGEHVPSGFTHLRLPGRRTLAISDLVTWGEFQRGARESGWLDARSGDRIRPLDRLDRGNPRNDLPATVTWHDALAYCAWLERALGVSARLLRREEHRLLRPFASRRYEYLATVDFPWENSPPREDLPSAAVWAESRYVETGKEVVGRSESGGATRRTQKKWIHDFPPAAAWPDALPWGEHEGLRFIDAWDAYEWIIGPHETGFVAGRYWEGPLGLHTWGAYKNCRVMFRVVIELNDEASARALQVPPPREEPCDECEAMGLVLNKATRKYVPCEKCYGERACFYDGHGAPIGRRRYQELTSLLSLEGGE